MTTLDIDFGKPRRNWSRHMALILALVALVISAFEGWTYFVYYREYKSWQFELENIQKRKIDDASKVEVIIDEELQAKLKNAAQLIDRIETPWEILFESMESVSEKKVALLSLVSDTERRELLVTAEAKDLDAMLSYVQQISTANGLTDVYLSSHQVNNQNPLHPILFTVIANWSKAHTMQRPTPVLMTKPAI